MAVRLQSFLVWRRMKGGASAGGMLRAGIDLGQALHKLGLLELRKFGVRFSVKRLDNMVAAGVPAGHRFGTAREKLSQNECYRLRS
jgi:hypothetical protein